jgi:hypothetical protein
VIRHLFELFKQTLMMMCPHLAEKDFFFGSQFQKSARPAQVTRAERKIPCGITRHVSLQTVTRLMTLACPLLMIMTFDSIERKGQPAMPE